jgi:hypothetical protein
MSSPKTINDNLRRVDPVGEEQLDQLEQSSPPQLLLEQLLDSDEQPSSPHVVAEPTAPSWRRRAPRLALGGAVAISAVATALIVSAGGDNTPAAYAVEPQPGGGVKLEIYNLGDTRGVEEALDSVGIASQVTYLGTGMTCREPHYQPSMALLRTLQDYQPQPQPWAGFNYESWEGPLTIAIGDYQQRRAMDDELREAFRQGDRSAGLGAPSFVIDPTGFRPDQTLIMSSSPTPPGYRQPIPTETKDGVPIEHGLMSKEVQIDTVGQVRVAEGTVDPCEPVPAPDGMPESMSPVRAPLGGWNFSDVPYAGWGF